MFTLKLYRRSCPTSSGVQTKTMAVHRVLTNEIGERVDGKFSAIEMWAFTSDRDYETYYIGEPSKGMEAYGKDDLHLNSEAGSWWGWGLLENFEGKTSQHYRPASYG